MNILIKFSGEFFTSKDTLTDEGKEFLQILKKCNISAGYLVVGGGNRLRGRDSEYERTSADHMGVISTLLNAFILKENLKQINFDAKVFSHFNDFGEKYDPFDAKTAYEENKWVILAGGLGKVCYVSTDLNSVIKSLELKVNAMIKVTPVGGIFDKDPKNFSDAKLLNEISYEEIFAQQINLMDLSAVAIASENQLSIGVCSIQNFENFINGANVGTIVGKDWRIKK